MRAGVRAPMNISTTIGIAPGIGRWRLPCLLLFCVASVLGCRSKSAEPGPAGTVTTTQTEAASPVQEARLSKARTAGYDELRNPYFGQTHQHTGWSFDAFIYDVQLGPENAFRHARGERVKHPAGYDVQLKVPLDFMVVSDHAEYLGVLRRMADPNDPLSQHPLAASVVGSGDDVQKSTMAFYDLVKATIQPDGSTKADPILASPEQKRSNWKALVEITDRFNDPGKFTTLPGFEWSSQPKYSNLHRNVIFGSSENLPEMPFSYFDSQYPEDLWAWMDAHRERGAKLLAIPHNGNLSNGAMFAMTDSKGRRIDKAYAEIRARNELLVEIVQTKGQSETHPAMSPNDDFAGFEIWTKPVGGPGTVKVVRTNYVRNAFQNGLRLERRLGINPFKYGVVGGGDIHTSIVSHEEYAHTGEHNLKSGTPEERLLQAVPGEPSKIEQGTAGLSCVWAEENTRESIFDAMVRRETWATSGPRITTRVFGGFHFGQTSPGDPGWVEKGYDRGVPMGGDLPIARSGTSPTLMIWALKDPNSGNLDRVQVIKGWIDKSGKASEKIYDVVWSGDRRIGRDGKLSPVGNTVDIKNASYTNTIGAAQLKTSWTDPTFDLSLPAFYYVRVLEIPTPRWSTYDAKTLGIEPPKGFPATIQERAWSSPIWYRP